MRGPARKSRAAVISAEAAGVASAAKTAHVPAATEATGVAAATVTTATTATLCPQRYSQHQGKRRNGHPTAHTADIISPHDKNPKIAGPNQL